MSKRAPRVLVLGGNGFIGRHTVSALRELGVETIVGSRYARPGQQSVRLQDHLTTGSWAALIAGFDAVVNCVGILRQRPGESYEQIHHLAPAALAEACATNDQRFVHVSALGLEANARSRFLSSKHRGESAIQRAGGNWVIARLSLLDGDGGYGAAWLRGVARLPVFVVPRSAQGDIAPLTAEDAGEALARLALGSVEHLYLNRSREFDLGGETAYGFAEYIRKLRPRSAARAAVAITIPGWLARLAAHVCDVLHFSPFSFGHWELLCADNVPNPNRLPEVLGRPPTAIQKPE